jgi:dimeric dUTPase (all-alpha-NTP-PPase superfamily)
MNLTKLFETQKILRDRIGYNEPDRFDKLILALLVEIGECANEWRGFKFWSKDQEQRTTTLEEFVDIFHFVLEIGLDLNKQYSAIKATEMENTIEEQFIRVYNAVLCVHSSAMFYRDLLTDYLVLGKMLGFTWEEVEEAYFAKNQINHKRQEEGY